MSMELHQGCDRSLTVQAGPCYAYRHAESTCRVLGTSGGQGPRESLAAEKTEIADISAKVDALLALIHTSADVPQEIVDAAAGLKTDLDALDAKAVPPA